MNRKVSILNQVSKKYNLDLMYAIEFRGKYTVLLQGDATRESIKHISEQNLSLETTELGFIGGRDEVSFRDSDAQPIAVEITLTLD